MKYYLGVDVGGTNLVAAVMDENYNIISKTSCKANLPRLPKLLADDIAEICNKAVEDSGLSFSQIENVGVGFPGVINSELGVVEYACNFGYRNVPMGEMLKKRLNIPVMLGNDGNAAAVGEFVVGAGMGYNSVVAITLGTGVGGGIIINGKIDQGFNYSGGEIGHTIIKMGGRPCNCGRRGCFEAYASATGLIKTTIEKMREYPDSILWKVAETEDKVEGKTVFDAMELMNTNSKKAYDNYILALNGSMVTKEILNDFVSALKGDTAVKEVFDEYILALSCGIINIINIFQPEIVCIGGGISKQGKVLLDPIQKIVNKEDYAQHSDKRCKIVTAKLGNDAGLIGAAIQWKYM